MMREILFKAKRIDNGEWVEGYFTMNPNNGNAYITSNVCGCAHPDLVDPETVCQYTGIDIISPEWDSSEIRKIFTGDILGDCGEDEEGNERIFVMGVVTYLEREGCYVLANENVCTGWVLDDCARPENWPYLVYCGNIHDKDETT